MCFMITDNSISYLCLPVLGEDQSCYNGTGIEYRGVVHITTFGRECQTWSDISTNLLHSNLERYTELSKI